MVRGTHLRPLELGGAPAGSVTSCSELLVVSICIVHLVHMRVLGDSVMATGDLLINFLYYKKKHTHTHDTNTLLKMFIKEVKHIEMPHDT